MAGDPAYRQLARALKLLIMDGRVPLGVRVPGERELALALGISRTTVAAAFNQLRDEGYLLSRQGSGTVTRVPNGRDASSLTNTDAEEADVINWTAAALPAPAGVWQAYEAALMQLPAWLTGLGYEATGIPRLREAIAADYVRRGCPTRPEQILVTSGAQHGLTLILRLLAGPGDRIVVDHPTYHNALSAISHNNCRAVPVGLPAQGWDIEAIQAVLRQTAPRFAYIIADYHNPTGRHMNVPTRRALVEAAARTRTPLVIDETMAEMTLEGDLFGQSAEGAVPPVAAFDTDGTVISLGSASKRYWGGLRIGWVRADEQTIAALGRVRATIDMATPIVEQLVVAALLESGAGSDSARRAEIRDTRDRLVALLADRLPDWKMEVPPGGLSLWAEMPRPEASALAAMAQAEGLRVAPGPRFGLDGAFERFVRLPFTLPPSQMPTAVDRLARASERLRMRFRPAKDPSVWALEAERVI
ncbi:MAG: PLP-dependent aminotransferase family protein [Sphingobium sp.]|nr:PLP-dependent aminotransferase family protein [Sphingobium sp.]MDX3911502.1 PLP-dependent aminotransferase family protein [Sphingobium sp.]